MKTIDNKSIKEASISIKPINSVERTKLETAMKEISTAISKVSKGIFLSF